MNICGVPHCAVAPAYGVSGSVSLSMTSSNPVTHHVPERVSSIATGISLVQRTDIVTTHGFIASFSPHASDARNVKVSTPQKSGFGR